MLTSGYPLYTTVRVPLPLDRAQVLVPRNRATHRPDGTRATLVTIGGTSPEELADHLLHLATPLRVLTPATVRYALRRRVHDLLDADEPEPN
ncbi:hypothetical protein [Streptomyces sp. NBC_00448]|uniref:hypothetical protein n=1 Tax=Streptomyces sp. NBC_00448 TaxID=2903652 RepID=UPI002E1D2F3D